MISSSSLAALSATDDDDDDNLAPSSLDRPTDDDDDEDGVVVSPSFFPPPAKAKANNKSGGLYSDDELQMLLALHNDLFVETVPDFLRLNEKDDRSSSSSDNSDEDDVVAADVAADSTSSLLQDLIVQTVQEIHSDEEEERKNDQPPTDGNSESNDNNQKRKKMGIKSESTSLKFDTNWDLTELQKVLPNIRCIACDVDGTLLASDHTLPSTTQLAIQNAIQSSFSPLTNLQHFFLATGKTRTGALSSLGQDMKTMLQQIPGVFVQGLYCVDATGNVVFEKKLSHKAVAQTEILAREFDDDSSTTTTSASASSSSSALLSVIAYDGDGLYASSSSSHPRHLHEAHERWGEPIPVVLENNLSEYEPGFHKLLLMMHDTDKLQNVVRPALEELAASLGDCVVTQAIPTMLELLPVGCSKSVGVEKLCQHLFLGLDDEGATARAFLSKHVCAIGDAENDMEMLQQAALGIAVGNASPMVKEIADVVMHETNDEGGAGRAIEWFGLGKLLDVMDSENKKNDETIGTGT